MDPLLERSSDCDIFCLTALQPLSLDTLSLMIPNWQFQTSAFLSVSGLPDVILEVLPYQRFSSGRTEPEHEDTRRKGHFSKVKRPGKKVGRSLLFSRKAVDR